MRPMDELAAALAKFQSEVPVIPKKQTAQIQSSQGRNYSYTYADLAAIAPVVLPLLAKHGLAFTARPTGGKGAGPLLVGMLIHTSGQYVTGELPITGRTPQEIGSSLTYGRRYLLGCLTGVVTDDDDDGALATKATRKAKEPPVAPPAPIQRRNRPRATEPTPGRPAEPPTGEPVTTGAGPKGEATPEVTDAARRALFGAVGKFLGPEAQRAERLALCAAVLGRPVASSTDLGRSEVSALLDWLDAANTGRATWSYDPDTETGIARYTATEPPPYVEDVPLPDPWEGAP
jgi:hypothetical protein